MMWHIFRKDCRLLWQMVLAVALVNAIRLVSLARVALPFVTSNRFSPVRDVSLLLDTILNLANIFVVVLVVQEDAIPGLQQDWLTRPVRRRDLLLGKIAFIVLLVQGPIFVAEVVQSLAYGFSLRQSLGPQLSKSLWMLFALDLPVLAFATLTRNLKEAIGAAAVIVVGFELLEESTLGRAADFAGSMGIGWVIDAVRISWILLAAGGILALQYGWRKTTRARWLYGSAAIVWLLVQFLPWEPAFALQEQLSSVPAAANPVQIVFEPGAGNGHGEGLGATPRRLFRAGPDAELWLPLHLKGTNDDDLVSADHVTARISDPEGEAIDLGNELEPGKAELWYPFKPLWVPESVYKKLREKRVRLEIDYSLTLLKANPSVSLPALDGNLRDTDAGWCATRKDSGRTAIELGCLIPGRAPCVSWSLENRETGKRFVQNPQCDQKYSPYVGRLGDTLSRFGTLFPFRAPLVEDLFFPVKESQLPQARVVIRTYRPVAHFTRRVMITDLKMSDWVG